jgi:drug/metabolite transporter, DME family
MKTEYLGLVLSAILYGTVAVGAQFLLKSGLSVYEVTFYQLILMSLMVLPVVLSNRNYWIKGDNVLFFIAYGFFGLLSGLGQFGAIFLGVPIAIVVVLMYSQPIWTILIGHFGLREKVTRNGLLAVAIGMLGVIIIINPWMSVQMFSFWGIILALAAGLANSMWIILGRFGRKNNLPAVTTFFGFTIFSAMWLLLVWIFLNRIVTEAGIIQLSLSLPPVHWLYLAMFALGSGVIPALLFFYAVKVVPAYSAGIILLLEAVSATILASIFFGQAITTSTLLGGALILISNYLVLKS